ncbi:hypothetical protein PHLCEN_2v3271 [Hermanssonia centrifuga]|uniref:Uncharacterized protein n=1 Tax=Hermanssonia centrifuga TaxID=98765 RepID=A0A2R6QUG1_9APHY|nr:hypothetical protein PHLCEN_2v3271 [Hermanssonia centrifuga]
MGGRSTAIKLSSGGVWVVASTPLNTETKETIDAMGSVEYGTNRPPFLLTGEWKKAYPEAKIIGMEGLPEKKKAERWAFFGCKYLFAVTRLIGLSPCQLIAYGIDPPETTYGFENDTLIVADLIFNLPAKEQYSKSSSSPKLAFFFPNFEPYSKFHQKFVWNEGKDKDTMKRDAQTVSEWDFERIIPCHGVSQFPSE